MAAVETTGGSSHDSREARRRRIIERGSDRLALITGRIQSLPPDPEQSRPADIAQHEDATSNSSLPNQESDKDPQQHRVFDERVEPLPHEDGSTISRSVALNDAKEELSQISSSTQSPAQDHKHEQSQRNALTSRQICSAIAASENIRICCSVAAAILVILTYTGLPIMSFQNIRGILVFKPVYLLLLTNISVVLARVILGTQGAELRTGRKSSVPTVGGNALVDHLGKALESALLLQNIFGALFMDFTIYAVVLVSGLSLVQRFGW